MEYALKNGYRYLIGDAGFFKANRDAHIKELSYIINKYPIPNNFEIRSLDTLPPVKVLSEGDYDENEAIKNLPPIIKAYLNLGARVSTQTFSDVAFGSLTCLF